ncbi:MAG: hypothetical protein EHM14_03835 [Methanothrix sp.]|nr:MAG: hypothetical protein EHM14_03835 [Methanothrix sp.]
MEFEIDKFANGFKNTIDWMLKDIHAQEIKEGLQYFNDNKNKLEKDPDSTDALFMIIRLVKTSGFRLKPRNFDNKLDLFIKKYAEDFRTISARDELIMLVGERKRKNVELLFTYPTLKEFTDNLYALANHGKTEVLGEKGRDNYLRDFGYWDRIPIDIHEMRFIIRSGIYHSFSTVDKSDHLRKSDLHDALTRFCRNCLNDYSVEGIDLSTAPGIVDAFIWSFSAIDIYNMCGAVPKCKNCNLRNVCLYSLANTQLVQKIME